MGLFGSSKKNRMVEDVPGETAEERLAHYAAQGRELEERDATPRSSPSGKAVDADPAQPGKGKLIDAQYQPLVRSGPQEQRPRRDAPVMDLESRDPDDDDHHRHHPRSFMDKLLHMPVSGWVQLGLVALVVGAIAEAGSINPFSRDFTWADALGSAWQGAVNVFSWAFGNGWRPFLVGAIVVGPLWLLWRLVTVPFRH